jgi:prepilin-type processing-associated H-X9-DG protein/prepilin-type N-terminal cleavage/methylation domain-containing protein
VSADRQPSRLLLAQARAGWTLIELLSVLAVIGILAGLLLPAITATNARVRLTRCAHHLRQLGLGLQFYADADRSGRLPGHEVPGRPPIGLNPGPTWVFNLSPYVPGLDRLRLCPADVMALRRATNFGCSYVLNDYTASDPRGHASLAAVAGITDPDGNPMLHVPRIRRLDQLPNPSGTPLVFEASTLGFLLGDHRTHPDTWFFGWSNVVADIDPYRHRGRANYLFGDLHVESLPGEQVKARIERGDNFAVPAP